MGIDAESCRITMVACANWIEQQYAACDSPIEAAKELRDAAVAAQEFKLRGFKQAFIEATTEAIVSDMIKNPRRKQ